MKPSSFRRLAGMAALTLLFSAFSSSATAPAPPVKLSPHYYFYLQPADVYDSFNSVADEILRLELMTGYYVDSSPFGGTLIATGYTNDDWPHNVWASSRLYAHH